MDTQSIRRVLRCAFLLSMTIVGQCSTLAAEELLQERIPTKLIKAWADDKRLVGSPSLAWTDRTTITVAFNGGSDQIRQLIADAASSWLDSSMPIKFSFKDKNDRWRTWSAKDKSSAATIRIAFSTKPEDGGYWSVIGRMTAIVPPNQQTMNLGDLETVLQKWGDDSSPSWKRSYAHGTIVHEFGHALGLAHEHFHPECQSDLDVSKIIAYVKGPPNNWSEEQALFNIDANYYFKASKTDQGKAFPKQDNEPEIGPHIDQASVMLYAFADDFYKSKSGSKCRPTDPEGYNPVASKGDYAALKAFYPGGN
ncbi:zinc metalloprotease [Rhizobium ruizarguesonis]|uniref:hypothetical protein n=1 Tax=Rhizobium ruizarguesonis TaxID=2081791 RepID=UPI001031B0EC|nr:hypothetical protein [Rhizobium ruizarguesonis]TAZ42067.1 hypothetical protein ELH74_22920 [Rhizobium ruizarguesonis]TBA06378.1 hypothetical protein ELH64_18915 [Rhizobium ruizarguesonis]